jgi:hypothetical protein
VELLAFKVTDGAAQVVVKVVGLTVTVGAVVLVCTDKEAMVEQPFAVLVTV